MIYIRQREEGSSFVSKLGQYLLELLDCAVTVIQGNDCLPLSSDLLSNGTSSIVASFRSFAQSPIFSRQNDRNPVDVELYGAIMQLMERLLNALANVYEEYSSGAGGCKFDMTLEGLSACDTPIQNSFLADSNKSRIVDMELDLNEDSRDVDTLPVGGKTAGGAFSSVEKRKLGMISLISNFFSVLHTTWDILFKLLSKESDQMVNYTLFTHASFSR